jgi:hypothetical protein
MSCHTRSWSAPRTSARAPGLRDPLEPELVLVDFKPVKDSRIGELAAKFDIVVGVTPADK